LKTDNQALELTRLVVDEKLALVKASEKAWNKAAADLASHLEGAAGGDAAKLATTGYEVRTAPALIGDLAAPAKLVVSTNGHEGVMKLRWPKVRGVKSWVVERTTNVNDATTWEQVVLTTQASFQDAGLLPGTKYWYRVAAVGTVGRGPWSDAICKMAV
jgi:hypothetical protein